MFPISAFALAALSLLSAASPAFGKGFYLDTEAAKYQQKEKTLLLAQARGGSSASPTGREVTGWIEAYTESGAYRKLAVDYNQLLYKYLGVPDPSAEDTTRYGNWRKANKELLKGIKNYTSGDPSGGGFSEDLNWATVNKKLLKGERLNREENAFYEEIRRAVDSLPKARGLVFRGLTYTQADIDRVRVGDKIFRGGFTSTSLSYEVAKQFAFNGKNPMAVIILETLGGWPVSPLTFGDLEEFEVLLAPGNEVEVTYKVIDTQANTAYIFARQLK